MQTQMVSVSDLKPYPGNAKKHDETQIKNVMQSIKEYGVVQPLVVDKNNVLIIGHCRLIAAKRLKLKEVPVVRLDDLSEEEAQKLRLLDNKLNESEWDFDLLADQVPELDFSDFDIDWELPEEQEEKQKEERKDVNYNESISVVIECANDEEAEETFTKLSEMGYSCKISTL